MRKLTLSFSFLFSILFSFQVSAQSAPKAQTPAGPDELPDFVEGKLYFKLDPSMDLRLDEYQKGDDPEALYPDLPELVDFIEEYDVERLYCPFGTPAMQDIYKMEFDLNEQRTDRLVKGLDELEYTNYAERIPYYRRFYQPDDIATEQEWYLDSIKAEAAWDSTQGDSNVTIAVVDDAVLSSHPDLQGAIKTNTDEVAGTGTDDDGNGYVDDVRGWDAADDDNDPEPPASHSFYDLGLNAFFHGTHTAGIASAHTDNNEGVASIGFGTSIIPVKTVSDNSSFPFGVGAAAEGIDYAIAADADVISMSFGGQQGAFDSTMNNVIASAHADSIVMVAAAGNDGTADTNYPAGFEEVIAVGSTSPTDTMSGFSNYGTWLDLVAPGDGIYSTYWDGVSGDATYAEEMGTSMSCPMVSGVVGLMLSHDPSKTPSEVRACLKLGAKNIDALNPSYVDSMGAGRLDALKALNCEKGDSAICYEESMLTEVACSSYTVPSGDTTYSSSGTYIDTLINAIGCDSVFEIDLTIGAVDTTVSTVDPITLEATVNGASYQWLDCDDGHSSINGETNPTFTASSNGSYAVEVSKNGCTDTSSCHTINSVGILEEKLGTEVKLYPNPTDEQVIIEVGETRGPLHMTVRDLSGRTVTERTVRDPKRFEVKLKGEKGMYLIELENGKGQKAVMRVVKN